MIKDYFSKYSIYTSDITIDLSNNNLEIHQQNSESWKIIFAV